ncbi:unnamed protein product [Nesidiocoris tenuis]|uniref:Protein VAC14 homolog n=1 Tax=Nesidiocoris tenuis TaxID=355587 RepID=A0A6H5FZN2_9HEMI|nr:unnamed protein product [Nesidiocoris tenuis]
MADKDMYAPLSSACVRALTDKQYDKRKAAATEIEKMVKEFAAVNNTVQIRKLLKVLGVEFTTSLNPNLRRGGLMGLAAAAIALGKDSAEYTESLIRPILTNFSDNDSKVRYSACEALFNVVKVTRGAVLPYFSEIFTVLSRLAADQDQGVKTASEHLDRLLKDIVTENATFDLVGFMPLLRERLYSKNTFARQYIISWVTVLDAVPDIQLILFLPELLDGLFNLLNDPNSKNLHLCILLSAEDIYMSTAKILRTEEDLKFARVMVDTLNTILLTSAELAELRNTLRSNENEGLFECLYGTWCHNPVATISLCLLTQNYEHTCDLIMILANYEVTVEFLVEVDRLIQLIESPIFTYLRLELLQVPHNYFLIRSMYGLLMLLPQSDTFHLLRHRLECIPKLHFFHESRSQMEKEASGNKYALDFNSLRKNFTAVQERHKL